MAETTPIKPPKLDHIDQAICNIAATYPGITPHAITKKLNNTGTIISHQAIYHRLRKSDYLRGELEKIQQGHREEWSRELMPLATKNARKVLKSKDIDDKDKYPYTALVAKTVLGDQGPAAPQTTINIGQMQVLQGIMRGNSDKVGILGDDSE